MATFIPFDHDKWKAEFETLADRRGKFAIAPSGTLLSPATPTTPTAAAPTPTPTFVPKGSRFIRPNGEEYFARNVTVGGLKTTDVGFIQQSYAEKVSVLLSGTPGCGKTALIEAALPNVLTVQGSLDTETGDFVGSFVPMPDGTYLWVDGPLPICMENGWALLIDEIALIDPRVMAIVYSVMDGRDEINISANPDRGTVKAKDGFMVYGCYNPDVPGAVVSDALLSRFTVGIEMTTDWKIGKKLGICEEAIKVAQNLNIKLKNNEVSAAPQLRELIAFAKVERIFGLDAAISNMLSFAHPEDLGAYQEAAQAVWSKMPTPLVF